MSEKPWKENAGTCPASAKGKRVEVELRNGTKHGLKPVSASAPRGWLADGRGGCRWTLTGHPFDIVRYRII